jgi:hypothetical protein
MKRDTDIGCITDEEIMAIYEANAGKPTLWLCRALVAYGYQTALTQCHLIVDTAMDTRGVDTKWDALRGVERQIIKLKGEE